MANNDYVLGARIGQAINIASQLAVAKKIENKEKFIKYVGGLTPYLVDEIDKIHQKEKDRLTNKTSPVKILLEELKVVKNRTQLKDFQNNRVVELSNLSKEDQEIITSYAKQHIL